MSASPPYLNPESHRTTAEPGSIETCSSGLQSDVMSTRHLIDGVGHREDISDEHYIPLRAVHQFRLIQIDNRYIEST